MALSIFNIMFGTGAFLLASYYNEINQIKDRLLAFPQDEWEGELNAVPRVDEYDFIVVGAGTAGSVVLNKLSEKFKVLVIEIGTDPTPMTRVPLYFHHTNIDNVSAHQWWSVPQTNSGRGIDNGKIWLAQGRALGGSTTINGMSYNRGHINYDNWANLTKDDNWSYNNLLPYFKMTENFYQYDRSQSDHIGFDGPIYISKIQDVFDEKANNMQASFLKAGEELGFETHENPNWPQKEGFHSLTLIRKDGRRISAYDGFIKPILDRENLVIHRFSEAKKIEFDESGRAIGVHYLRHGVGRFARASKEIILSAGTLNSPLILMRSGVGPKEDLEAAGIEVIQDLPVGRYNQDHPALYYYGPTLPKSYYGDTNPTDEINKYVREGKGPLGNFLEIFSQAFIVSEDSKKEGDDDWPDIQLIAGINSSVLIDGDDKVLIYISLGRVTSVGNLKLDITDPHNNPIIWDPNFLETERDINTMVYAMKLSQRIFETDALKGIGEWDKTPLEQCAQHQWGSDQYYECYAREQTRTIWHPTGSCKMGSDDDPAAITDSRLRVRGLSGLRVIDNSVQPMVTNANTMSPAYVLGQRGSAMILEDYGL